MKISFSRSALTGFALVFSKLSLATPVPISTGYQSDGLGFFSGSLDYVATSNTTATLTLILNNLSTTAAGGKITGVALNIPQGGSAAITGLTFATSSNFQSLGLTSNGINGSPLGYFDIGAATKPNGNAALNWQGGFPNKGITINSSETFSFNLTGSNLSTLSTLSFINAIATGTTQGPSEFIAVRFLGFTGANAGRGDKVGGTALVSPPPPPVPVPASIWLMLSGLGGLGLISRKRKANV